MLLSVPHAGRDYPAEVFDALRVAPAALIRLEDRYADLLARRSIQFGHPVVIAHRARAWIDLNRDETDLDVEMVHGADRAAYPEPGAKQRGGLGLIPRRLSGDGDLWKRQFTLHEVQERIVSFHRPYHACIDAILQRMRHIFGVAILLDLHSMPPIRNGVTDAPVEFVIGDRFGKSAASKYAELLHARLRDAGFTAALNHPYAGEHVLRRHALPKNNIHAIQLEVDRSLYLDARLNDPAEGLARIQTMIANVIEALADEALGQISIAAE